ncbi:hypothetical protein KCP69_18490 [Salmonella enterica subsp. enterica]|nr:hypothetical protein KCP69_18490 [Salmonella enterica subsp. enterica]
MTSPPRHRQRTAPGADAVQLRTISPGCAALTHAATCRQHRRDADRSLYLDRFGWSRWFVRENGTLLSPAGAYPASTKIKQPFGAKNADH